MKRKIIKILVLEMMLFLLVVLKSTVEANSIDSINMDIYIDSSGNANVTETWKCNTNKGTECYHPYYNLGNSEITNLTVSDTEKNYVTTSLWDTTDVFEGKKYKCGINYINDGIEICWGISQYGKNTYKVKYIITNFVSNLTDSQMVYWTLIPHKFSDTIKEAKIKIYSDNAFEDTIPVWGYGNYGGHCYVNNGAIYMQSNGKLASDEYMTLLAKFPKGMFNSNNNLNNSFEYYFQKAQDGAKGYQERKQSEKVSKFMALFMFIALIGGALVIKVIKIYFANTSKEHGFSYGKEGKVISKEITYYRKIPCRGDIFSIYYIAYHYGLTKNKSNILGAILLKWIKNGTIKIENREKKDSLRRDYVIKLEKKENEGLDSPSESRLYEIIYSASENGILENREFKKWCKKNHNELFNWFYNFLKKQRDQFVEKGYIKRKNIKKWKTKYTATKFIKNDAVRIAGLKKYLLEYTLIEERQPIEVKIFEDYLIFAQVLGIAKRVSKEFKTLYPELIEKTNFIDYDILDYISDSSSDGFNGAQREKTARDIASDYSSGGGGSGSFGGGGGGGRIPLNLGCIN